jgi:multicomponent Na+:H+ antiporter subunit D
MIALVPLVVLIPLAGSALALAVPGHRKLQQGITLVALSFVLVLSGVLMWLVDAQGTLVMEVGGWAAPFGIALVVDRVSALMLVVSSIVLLGVFLFSIGQGLADGDEDTPVSIYYPTYLVLGAGVFNAFIAGDLFNLYVGFEILLVASYVLITLGGTVQRIRAGVTYVIVSLVSSVLFLAAIALIYGRPVRSTWRSSRCASPNCPARYSCCSTWRCSSRSGSKPPCSRSRSGCPTPIRQRRLPSRRCSRVC